MQRYSRDSRCKRSASIEHPRRCHRGPPKCKAAAETGSDSAISAERGGTRVPADAAQYPEVAGSNPAHATHEGPGTSARRLIVDNVARAARGRGATPARPGEPR